MGGKPSERSKSVCSGSVSHQLRSALHDMRSASALISLLIKEERAQPFVHEALERLYTAKGAVACAIEETEQELSNGQG